MHTATFRRPYRRYHHRVGYLLRKVARERSGGLSFRGWYVLDPVDQRSYPRCRVP